MKPVKLEPILFVILVFQLFFVDSVFPYEKIVSNPVQYCKTCSEDELLVAIIILQHLEFQAVHGENHISLNQIKADLQSAKERLKKSKVVSLQKEGKFSIKGEITHVVCNGNKLVVPEYFLTNDLQALDRAKISQSGADTPYENCPKTIKDYARRPTTKLSDDKFCHNFLNMYPGIFNSRDIGKCFDAHADACSFTISVDDKTRDIKTFTSPIQIKGRITAGGSDSGSIDSGDSRLIFNFVSEQAFSFSTTKGYLKKFYSVDPVFQLWVHGPNYGIEELGYIQTTETDREWEEKIFYALKAKYPDKKDLLNALNNVGKGHRRVFYNVDVNNCSFEPFDGVGTYTVHMRAGILFLPRTLEETRIFLLSKDIENRKYLRAAYNSETESGLQRIRSAINESDNRRSFISNVLKILFAPEIQLFNGKTKVDSDWTNQKNRMESGSVYFVNDNINLRIDCINPENGEAADQKVLRIRKFKDDKPLGWQNLPLSTLEWRFSPNKKHVYITIPWQKLVEIGAFQPQADDGIPEYSSLDIVLSPKLSGFDDSEAFIGHFASKGYHSRGYAKGVVGKKPCISPPITELSKDFLKAAGVEFFQVSFGNIESDVFQVQNQADVFYMSGHGGVKTGCIIIGSIEFSAKEAIANWNQEVKTIIFALCSVLKIKNYNRKFPGEPEKQKASPGEIWAEMNGKLLLGYCESAPTDLDKNNVSEKLTKDILLDFFKLGGNPEDWLIANNNSPARLAKNACFIDTRTKPYRYGYLVNGWFGASANYVLYDHTIGKWPDN
ncbi:MAG TPA: hypothetical protein PKL52_11120 [Tenuifilaceae bacterium]|nr:hypothetical protein [Tenuifilaceae bacterium]